MLEIKDYHKDNIGKCITIFTHPEFNKIRMTCVRFVRMSQFAGQMKPRRLFSEIELKQSNAITVSPVPTCLTGEMVYALDDENIGTLLVAKIDSSG